jgi:hypothetical protein
MMEGEDLEIDLESPELDVEDLDDEAIEIEDDFVEGAEADDETIADEVDSDEIKPGTTSRRASEDEDDDDDLRTEDDVEADLDAILREKLTAAEEVPLEDDEEEAPVDDKTDGLERLQPRRPDEIQCTQCFLLVRKGAPGCPVEDDACPLFSA